MVKRIAAAFLAIVSIAVAAPAAYADQALFDCDVVAVQHEPLTGSAYWGVLSGWVAHEGSNSINCRIEVNGVTQASSGVGVGVGVATTAKDVYFWAGDTDVVQLCADHTSGHSSGSRCITLSIMQMPPQVVYDTIDSVVAEVHQPLCVVLRWISGSYGPVVIDSEGDVFVAWRPVYDCPPHDQNLAGPSDYVDPVNIIHG